MSNSSQEIIELGNDELDIIKEYTDNNKLHPDWLPVTTYNMVQMGYPLPNRGVMVALAYGGTDKDNLLLPTNGTWCKFDDIKKYLPKPAAAVAIDFPVQFGKCMTCDFELKTWTFQMPDDFKIIAGEFAIIPKDNYVTDTTEQIKQK